MEKEEERKNNDKDNNIDDIIKINDEIKKQESQIPKIRSKTKDNLNIPLKTKRIFHKDDFEIISLSGKGAYGTVLKVQLKSDNSNKLYAIKVMDIKALTRIKKLYQAYLECDILSQINCPYIVDILGSFTEHGKIYIVMEYLSKGDFSDFIRLNYPLNIETIKFYSAEIVCFLEYIQSKKIVHRDLKPENIMMNEKWHIQVIDFGTARILGNYFDKINMIFKEDSYYDISETDDLKGNKIAINEEEDDDDFDDIKSRPERRGMTFVGTAEYVSPEVLGDKPAEFGVDIWALGIMIYQMFFGKTPFKDKTNFLIFRKIEQLNIDFDDNEKIKIPEEAKDLIKKILVKDPSKRLGAGESGTEYDISHLKSHPFFKGINWNNLLNLNPPNCENFDYLLNGLKDLEDKFILPAASKNSIPSPFGFLITCKNGVNRNKITTYLEKANIQTRTLFAGNIVKHPCFDEMRKTGEGYRVIGDLKNTDIIMNQTFWIGVYPGMTTEKLDFMIRKLHEAVR